MGAFQGGFEPHKQTTPRASADDDDEDDEEDDEDDDEEFSSPISPMTPNQIFKDKKGEPEYDLEEFLMGFNTFLNANGFKMVKTDTNDETKLIYNMSRSAVARCYWDCEDGICLMDDIETNEDDEPIIAGDLTIRSASKIGIYDQEVFLLESHAEIGRAHV